MILASNGIKTFVFDFIEADRTMSLEEFRRGICDEGGICLESMTIPTGDGTTTTMLINSMGSGDAPGNGRAGGLLRLDPSQFIWFKEVEHGSELFKRVRGIPVEDPETETPAAPAPKKIPLPKNPPAPQSRLANQAPTPAPTPAAKKEISPALLQLLSALDEETLNKLSQSLAK
jgi:hypothetical protein